ncbi:Dam family site-specific DNA-(adenine-N6)-methyltransferase [Aliarcobacter cryaerophilus]|uniref:DNA adenine methylase n=1 Tax=Aliarcobacter cryaerophilus TaxID=28198 RepID=UPI003DA6B7D4
MKIKPFLRWVGGKRWLIKNHSEHFPKNYNKYVEPFLGAGSVFFFLQPRESILSDLNPELINTYKCIKDEPESLFKLLKIHQNKHSKEYYYEMRNKNPNLLKTKAARFLYLNRTCFNGIYRVNKQGKFNVPYGNKSTVVYENESFDSLSKVLTNSTLLISDFEKTINLAHKDDFLFVDPPYTVAHNNNGFIEYNEKIFSWDDQLRLFNVLKEAKNRGVKILLTNANHLSIKELYKNDFILEEVSRYSSVSGLSQHRKKYSELIIKSYS